MMKNHMPEEISSLIQEFARPITRADWRKGSEVAKVFKNSTEFKDFEYHGYQWSTYPQHNHPRFDATFAYEWANQRWSDQLIKQIEAEGGTIGLWTVDQHTKFCLNTGKMKWFWYCEPYYDFLDYDFRQKIWYIDV